MKEELGVDIRNLYENLYLMTEKPRYFRRRTILEEGYCAAVSLWTRAHGYHFEYLLLFPDEHTCHWSRSDDLSDPEQRVRTDIPLDIASLQKFSRLLYDGEFPDFNRGIERGYLLHFCHYDFSAFCGFYDNPQCEEWLESRGLHAIYKMIHTTIHTNPS
ncbi:hypothetical protein [Armatimonas rosea]|uniref:Uncharacterized protein n=1 Tax=Armatimonas rosea TaxID=685828 RepID=A0A7W9STE4_ARMRO|nr:hypothetical protein [Armatimonas rosea]MBB6052511.1 hypothetical protein [Armatimonas rosea]